jgi:hypothetical protein
VLNSTKLPRCRFWPKDVNRRTHVCASVVRSSIADWPTQVIETGLREHRPPLAVSS